MIVQGVNESKNRLLLDCDGVLADWMTAVNDVIERATGRRISPQECGGWLKLSNLGFSPTERKYIEHELNAPGFVEELAPLPGAVEGVQRVVEATGCHLSIVTAHWDSPTWMYERKKWLKKWGFLKEGRGMVATREKWLVAPGLLVDDKIQNVLDYNAKSVGGHAVLWQTDFNAVDPARKFTQQVGSWDEVLKELQEYVRNN